MNPLIIALLVVCVLLIPCQVLQAGGSSTGVCVSRLRCEYPGNPLGIDAVRPRLSWIMESNEPLQQQTAYQILVASGKELLGENKADLWDSGKVACGNSVNIVYSGNSLESEM